MKTNNPVYLAKRKVVNKVDLLDDAMYTTTSKSRTYSLVFTTDSLYNSVNIAVGATKENHIRAITNDLNNDHTQ